MCPYTCVRVRVLVEKLPMGGDGGGVYRVYRVYRYPL